MILVLVKDGEVVNRIVVNQESEGQAYIDNGTCDSYYVEIIPLPIPDPGWPTVEGETSHG